jgi:hypothetical protein
MEAQTKKIHAFMQGQVLRAFVSVSAPSLLGEADTVS